MNKISKTLAMSIRRQLGLDPESGVFTASGELHFNCPFCVKRGEPTPDTRRRLYVHVADDDRKGSYLCFRCGKKGRLLVDVAVRNRPPANKRVPRDTALLEEELPLGLFRVTPSTKAWDYLVNVRRIDPLVIEEIRPLYGRGRIYFPDRDRDGRVIGWTARTLFSGPKYLSSSPNLGWVWGAAKLWDTSPEQLWIAEGVISAFSCGQPCVATLGKLVSREQLGWISAIKAGRHLVAFDGDALDEATKLCWRITAVTGKPAVLVPLPPQRDPGDLGRTIVEELAKFAVTPVNALATLTAQFAATRMLWNEI